MIRVTPVRRAELVRNVEALEAEHARAPAREVVQGGASHPADSDHDHVVALHARRDSIPGWLNGSVSTTVEELGENRVRLTVEVDPAQVQARGRPRDVRSRGEREDPRLPQGQDPDPRPRLASGEGPDLRRGGGEPHRRLVLERGVAQPRAPGLRAGVRVRASGRPPTTAWRFAATVEVQPLPELVDWTTLEVPRAEVDVPQEAVDAELEALRESVAELAPANGRPAREGDTLVVDLVDPSGEAQRDTVVELGAGPAWRASSRGRSSARPQGIRRRSRSRAPTASSTTVEVTVREVQEKVLPPLDDDLARAASEFDTLAELRGSIEGTFRGAARRRDRLRLPRRGGGRARPRVARCSPR